MKSYEIMEKRSAPLMLQKETLAVTYLLLQVLFVAFVRNN